MRKFWCLAAAAAALACGKRGATRPQVGVALAAAADSFDVALQQGMQQMADSLGADLHVVSADGDSARQDSEVDGLVARRMDAIVIVPVGATGGGAAVAKGNQAGIPVFTAGRGTDDGEIVTRVASDDHQGGRLLGAYVAARLNGGGNVAILDQPSLATVRDRVAGFKEALGGYPNIRIQAAPAVEPATRAAARRKMEALLATDQHLDAVFATDDECALGALAAIQAAGKPDVVVVAYDADPEARAAVLQGTPLVALAAQDGAAIGAQVIASAVAKLKGQAVAPAIAVPVRLVQKP